MHKSIIQFRNNIGLAQDLGVVYSSIQGYVGGKDLSDILRTQLLMSTSSLDHYIHCSIDTGMLLIYQNLRPTTNAFEKFQISMKNIRYITANPTQTNWFKAEIQERLGWQSFQRSKNISEAIKLISNKNLWDEVGLIMNKSTSDVKIELNLIIDRRNIISHEADVDPNDEDKRLRITTNEVDNAVNFILKLGNAIYEVIK